MRQLSIMLSITDEWRGRETNDDTWLITAAENWQQSTSLCVCIPTVKITPFTLHKHAYIAAWRIKGFFSNGSSTQQVHAVVK